MLTLALPFPAIDPVLIEIGPFAIRWYALAYIAGLVLGWQYVKRLVQRPGWRLTPTDIDDLLVYITLGVVIGGRLGYVLFYRPGYYLSNPLEALAVWHGGMSFHGGALGVLAAALFSHAGGTAPRSRSSMRSAPPRRSACSSGGSRTSSTASCSGA